MGGQIHKGVVKWPLKKLLEEFMPREFIYRQKSGFVPPFAAWLTDRDFNHRVRDILLSKDAFVCDLVPRGLFEELLSDALDGRKLRSPVLFFLWGAVFTEAWVQKYRSSQEPQKGRS